VSDLKMGGALVLLAAIANASFALPMKWMSRWSWENIWLVWSVASLLVLPLGAACITVPQLFSGYGEVAPAVIARVVFFGIAWGIAQVLFGLSVDKIGMALTFSIVLGTSAAVGTIVPFIRLHPELLSTRVGGFIVAGVLCVVCGMVLCARAGLQREREAEAASRAQQSRSNRGGLILAFVSGLCASFMNLGISFAAPLLAMSARHGSSSWWSLNAVWLPLLAGGAIPNLCYSIYLLAKRRSLGNYRRENTSQYWLFCVLMSALWFGSSLAYGVASSYLGILGPIVGWPLFMSLIVICASLLGWMSGEWRTATRRPLQLHVAGIAFLVLALFFLSRGSA
jgi:L-rhamnose-H+ transport protein